MTDAAILELMDKTVAELEERFAYVEEQGWNLLVCAIGAEVQAFGLGREMLAEMLGVGARSRSGADGVTYTDHAGAHGSDELDNLELDRRRLSHARAGFLHEDAQDGSTRSHSPVTNFAATLQPRYAEGSGDDEPDDDMLGTLQS